MRNWSQQRKTSRNYLPWYSKSNVCHRIAIKIDTETKQPSLTTFHSHSSLRSPRTVPLLAAFFCEPSLQPRRCDHYLRDLRMTHTATGQFGWGTFTLGNTGGEFVAPLCCQLSCTNEFNHSAEKLWKQRNSYRETAAWPRNSNQLREPSPCPGRVHIRSAPLGPSIGSL